MKFLQMVASGVWSATRFSSGPSVSESSDDLFSHFLLVVCAFTKTIYLISLLGLSKIG